MKMARKHESGLTSSVPTIGGRFRVRTLPTLLSCVSLILLMALSVAACGGGGSGITGGGEEGTTGGGEESTASGNDELATAKSELDALYRGEFGKPSPSSVVPRAGADVWGIVGGYESAGSKIEAEEFKRGAEELGWNATLRDGKFNPSVWLSTLREAVQAHPDAIWLEGIDCGSIEAGLKEAKRAGIPVVASIAQDCDPPLFSGETDFLIGDNHAFYKAYGESQAIWAIANTDAEAKVLLVYENDLQSTQEVNDAAKGRFEKCQGCEITGEVTFTGAEFGPPLQQKVEQALLQHPNTAVVDGNYDAAVENGIAAAVRNAGKPLLLLGGEGQPNNVELVREGVQSMGFFYPFGWVGYAALNGIVRLLGGETGVGDSGIGYQVYDAEHNLPPKGQAYTPPVSYKKLYRELWGL